MPWYSILTWGDESHRIQYSFEVMKVGEFLSSEVVKVAEFHTLLRWWKSRNSILSWQWWKSWNSILTWGTESHGIPSHLRWWTSSNSKFIWGDESCGIPYSPEVVKVEQFHTRLRWWKSRNSTLTYGGDICGIPYSPEMVKVEESHIHLRRWKPRNVILIWNGKSLGTLHSLAVVKVVGFHAHLKWWKSRNPKLIWGDESTERPYSPRWKSRNSTLKWGGQSRGLRWSLEVVKAVDLYIKLRRWKTSELIWDGEGFCTHLRWWMSRAYIHTWGGESRGLLYSFEVVKVVDFILTWGGERHLYSFEMLKVEDFHTHLRWWKTSELIWDT